MVVNNEGEEGHLLVFEEVRDDKLGLELLYDWARVINGREHEP